MCGGVIFADTAISIKRSIQPVFASAAISLSAGVSKSSVFLDLSVRLSEGIQAGDGDLISARPTEQCRTCPSPTH